MSLPAIAGEHETAELTVEARSARVGARLTMTPTGLLAVGGLVGAILLGSAAIVLAAGHVRGRAG